MKSVTMGNFGIQEAHHLVQKERRRFLWMLLGLGLCLVGALAATTILAVKLDGKYPSARIGYHVWTHEDPKYGFQGKATLKVPHKATVYTLMEHAAQLEKQYQFSYYFCTFDGGLGRIIQSIGGSSESHEQGLYWMLYKLDEEPDLKNPPTNNQLAPLGVDDERVEDGQVYLFWLRKYEGEGRRGGRNNALQCIGDS